MFNNKLNTDSLKSLQRVQPASPLCHDAPALRFRAPFLASVLMLACFSTLALAHFFPFASMPFFVRLPQPSRVTCNALTQPHAPHGSPPSCLYSAT
ncbi:hypothetical protein BC826DRAFT_1051081 [Russula brevipes]|nr:hypothetical protein BC826DRAFT_1051081 [Russula brevipes]